MSRLSHWLRFHGYNLGSLTNGRNQKPNAMLSESVGAHHLAIEDEAHRQGEQDVYVLATHRLPRFWQNGGIMRTRRIASITVVTVVVILASVIAHADQPQAISPDHVEKGKPTTITITLDKNIPNMQEIRHVRLAGLVIEVKEPTAEGSLSVPLPGIDKIGTVDIEVLGKDDKPVAAGKLTYIEPGSPNRLLFLYVGLIVLLPVVCTIYDMSKSYRERMKVLGNLRPQTATVEEVKTLLVSMSNGPTGFTGLTRGIVAVTLVLIVGFAIFHLVVFAPSKLPDIADKLLMLIAGTLTSIVGFYFGSKAATDAASQNLQSSGGKGGSAVEPTISAVTQGSGPDRLKLTISGAGFGTQGTVKIGDQSAKVDRWEEKEIAVTFTDAVKPGPVDIVVTNGNGNSSKPYPTTIK
ncbi:MAG TPA: IPT/TIG domain-containing protein [Candidatus Angelobacter sp.]|jgi:hypothetical protein|nr:IPT/TIG domain-containing protein [Candidatus Angelobacter sp.]